MKKTSKFLSAFLALVMAFALAVPAFASVAGLGQQWQQEACDLMKVTFSNQATGAGDIVWEGNANDVTHVFVVPDGTTITMNPAVPIVYFHMWWGEWFEGQGATSFADGAWRGYSEPLTINGKNERAFGDLYYIGLQLENGGDGYEPAEWYAVMPQSLANYLASLPNGDRNGTTFVWRDSSGTTQPSTPSTPSTSTGTKPAPGVSVPLNNGTGEFAYTIKSGDTLGKIAAYYYGNVNVYRLIYERNKDILKSANAIYAGQTITLPSYAAVAQGVASTQPSTPSTSTPSKPITSAPSASTSVKPAAGVSQPLNDGSGEFAYTVKSGDTLSRIAAYYYGNANVYKLIYERNKDILKSANSIYAGQTIILPSYAAVAQGVAKL